MLERSRRRCKEIRNRLYPEDQWPGVIHENEIVKASGPDRVYLGVGCGREARLVQRLAKRFRLALGIDLEIARQGHVDSGYRLIEGDAHQLPLADDCVDVLGTADVVEHLGEPVIVMRECARVLRPGGKLIIRTVNQWYPPILMGRLLPHGLRRIINRITTGTKEEDTFPTHYAANSRRSLEAVGKAAGFKLAEFRYVSHHPQYFMFSVLVYRCAIIAERIIRRYDCLRGLRQFFEVVFELPDGAGGRGSAVSWNGAEKEVGSTAVPSQPCCVEVAVAGGENRASGD